MSNTSKTPKKRAAAKTTVVKKRKSGSGRTKGSFSFINVTLRQSRLSWLAESGPRTLA